jgi:hypothetical protein
VRTSHALAAARIVAVALLAGVLCPPATQAASTPPPTVTISPLPGTPDATPSTQISFLGVAPSALSQIEVRGSHTGNHSGRLEAYSTGTGASYLPTHPFSVGEHVTVTALETANGTHQKISTSFTIARLYVTPRKHSHSRSSKPLPLPPTVRTFVSEPQLHPPKVTLTTPAADPALGDIFLTPKDEIPQQGPMIVNPKGQLVWFSPLPPHFEATDLLVQRYLGQKVLTYWAGSNGGHGLGEGVIDNTEYHTIATVKAGNGMQMDLHEFDVEPRGVAYFAIYEPLILNLTSMGGPANAIVDDGVVQEVDVRTGLVMFEWHALGHVPLSDSYALIPRIKGAVWDWFHINSIDVERHKNLLISARGTWAVYQLDQTSGKIRWTIGGRQSNFKLGPGVRFAWQHDAIFLPNGTIQIFDNEDDPEIEDRSRGIDIALDFATHTAKLLHQYVNPGQKILTPSQGDVQQLPNGDHLLGWGSIGLVSEVSPAGRLTLEMHLPAQVDSYRAFRIPWCATGEGSPSVAAKRDGASGTELWVSWNGDTRVVRWLVLGGGGSGALKSLGTFARSGFETAMRVDGSPRRLVVRGLDAAGRTLGQSATLRP